MTVEARLDALIPGPVGPQGPQGSVGPQGPNGPDPAPQIEVHRQDTTDVHGIADTARLVTIDNIGSYAPPPDLSAYQTRAEKGQPLGYAPVDAAGLIPNAFLPPLAITRTQTAASQAAMLALTTEEGDVVIRSDQSRSYVRNAGTAGTMADFNELLSPPSPILSVNGQVGVVLLAAADVGATTPAALAAHEADTTAIHGIADTATLVLTSDARLSDQRTPSDSSVTNAKVAATAGIAYSKLNLAASVALSDLAFDPATQVELDAEAGARASADAQLVTLAPVTAARNTVQPGADVVPLTLKGRASQSANMQEWQDSSGAVRASVAPNGSYFTGGTVSGTELRASYFEDPSNVAGYLQMNFDATHAIMVLPKSASKVPLSVQGFASQSADIQQWQDSGGSVLMRIQASGHLVSGAGVNIISSLGLGTGSGGVYTPSYASILNLQGGVVTVGRNDAGVDTVRMIVKGKSPQTTNLQEWQDSAGTPKSWVTAAGNVVHATGDIEAENKVVANVLTTNRTRIGFDGSVAIAGFVAGNSNDARFLRVAAGVFALTKTGAYPTAPTMDGAGLMLASVTTPPSTNPVGGGILYDDAGALKWRGTSGTVTTVAPA